MSVSEQIASLLRLGPGRAEERRTRGRARTERLASDIGQVLDLSKEGAKILSKKPWPRGEVRTINLLSPTIGLTIEARCVWEKQEGRKKYLLGLQFENITDGLRAVVTEMMRSAAPASPNTWTKHPSDVAAASAASGAAPAGAKPILGIQPATAVGAGPGPREEKKPGKKSA